MKISIAMATYNGAKYLQEQLDSFADQTRLPDELVVCDDYSTDETIEILRQFAEVAPFEVKVFLNERNLGYAQNFGRALALCTGDLIFLSDQDDVWFPEKLTVIENLAIEDDYSQVFMNDAELVYHDLSPTGLTKQGQIKSAGMTNSNFVMGCCMAIRRDFLQRLLPIPVSCKGHDVWLSKFAEGLQQRCITLQVLQIYRRHESNESTFVANKTYNVSVIDTFSRKLLKVFENRRIDSQSNDLIDSIAFHNEIRKILTAWLNETNDQELKLKIKSFKDAQKKLCETLECRLEIKSMCVVKRVFMGFNFYLRGGYKDFNGFLSYARDIVA